MAKKGYTDKHVTLYCTDVEAQRMLGIMARDRNISMSAVVWAAVRAAYKTHQPPPPGPVMMRAQPGLYTTAQDEDELFDGQQA